MRLNKSTSAMLLAGLVLSFSTSAATLTRNDDANTITGLDTSQMLSKDNGSSWVAYSDASQNSFPGKVTVIVAAKDDTAIKAIDYDPTLNYATAGTVVRYNGSYWSNKWYASVGEIPGSNEVWQNLGSISVKKLATFNFTPWTGQKATDFQNSEKSKVANQRKVIGYFPEWGVYDAHNNFTADKVNFSQLTHLNYGFGIVNNNGGISIQDTNAALAMGTLPNLSKMAAANGVAYMISFGGWNNSQEGVFEAATATDAGINTLADNMINFMQKYNFDGVDVDWEYPDSDAEKTQFTKLIQTLRSKLDTLGKSQDKYYQLSAAVTTNHNNIQYINPSVTAGLLDSVNVMAYDIHGAFDPITGHNAPLFANGKDSDPLLNVASTMKEYNETWGVAKNKLMMGVPFYGRGWGSVEPKEIVKGLPGLFAAGSATVHGAWDDTGQFTGTNPYYLLKNKQASGEYTRYWDNESKVPYLYNAKTKEFLTYDDATSIQTKVNYILEQGFGGAIIWDISGDTPEHELGAIVAQLKSEGGDDGGDDEGGGDSTVSELKLSYLSLNFDAGNTGTMNSNWGIRFNLDENDFRANSYDVRVNGNTVAQITAGKINTGKYVSANGVTTVTTDVVDLKANDIITIVKKAGNTENVQASLTATRTLLQIGLLTQEEPLRDFNVINGEISLTIKALVPCNYHFYINDKYVAGLNQPTPYVYQSTKDNLNINGIGRTSTNITLKQRAAAGDDVKVYDVSNGGKTLVGQITVPQGVYPQYL